MRHSNYLLQRPQTGKGRPVPEYIKEMTHGVRTGINYQVGDRTRERATEHMNKEPNTQFYEDAAGYISRTRANSAPIDRYSYADNGQERIRSAMSGRSRDNNHHSYTDQERIRSAGMSGGSRENIHNYTDHRQERIRSAMSANSNSGKKDFVHLNRKAVSSGFVNSRSQQRLREYTDGELLQSTLFTSGTSRKLPVTKHNIHKIKTSMPRHNDTRHMRPGSYNSTNNGVTLSAPYGVTTTRTVELRKKGMIPDKPSNWKMSKFQGVQGRVNSFRSPSEKDASMLKSTMISPPLH
eukprot:m.344809 g.344809  ORF g.344809 m.344809 type:complete len:294 (+) comp25164_c0_seq1:173-1054(+)